MRFSSKFPPNRVRGTQFIVRTYAWQGEENSFEVSRGAWQFADGFGVDAGKAAAARFLIFNQNLHEGLCFHAQALRYRLYLSGFQSNVLASAEKGDVTYDQ